MPKNALKGVLIVFGVMFLFGCASTDDIEVRRYVEIRDRIDQNMEGGNAGYLSGSPQPEDRSEYKKTRRVYVLEVSKGEGNLELENNGGSNVRRTSPAVSTNSNYTQPSARAVPVIDPIVSSSETDYSRETSFVDYTVGKDDTLQKISKKFYDSYSQWPKIYRANKDVIGDPDKIKPGIVIRVPVE